MCSGGLFLTRSSIGEGMSQCTYTAKQNVLLVVSGGNFMQVLEEQYKLLRRQEVGKPTAPQKTVTSNKISTLSRVGLNVLLKPLFTVRRT